MKFSISKNELLPPLQQVVGVVERKQTHEVMHNLLFDASSDRLLITGTDNEVEHRTHVPLIITEDGVSTIPARKLLDICRSLPDDAHLDFQVSGDKARILAGKSRFTLTTLPHEEFPLVDPLKDAVSVSISQKQFAKAIKMTSFAMAQQDVRYYLNGLLLELSAESICCVATDGHRLALHRTPAEIDIEDPVSAIIPRKAISELARLLDDSDSDIDLLMTGSHLQLRIGALQMTTKLIDGKFPDYERVIPLPGGSVASIDRDLFRQALARSAILANETYKGVRLSLADNAVGIQTNNPNHEEAEDELEIDYTGDPVEVGFNVTYLLDVLSIIDSEIAELHLKDDASSMVIHPGGEKQSTYVIMPMRL